MKENSGIYAKLPFTSQKRPEADFQILKGTLCQDPDQREPLAKQTMDDGFLEIRISGEKFIVIATKKEK